MYAIKAGQRQPPSDFDPASLTSKRQKTQGETPQSSTIDFKQKFEEEFKFDTPEMEDDEFCLADHLFSLEKHFATRSAIEWLKSQEARKPDSRTRAMVESGRKSIQDMTPDQLARVVFAAIIIGGKTLRLYLNSFEEYEKSKRGTAQDNLDSLLANDLDFDEIFSTWLSHNLHRLNEAAIKLLDGLDKDSDLYVRLAIVSTFDYDSQLAFFKSRARMLLQHFPREKITTIEGAINLTNDRNIELDMMQLGQVIKAARDLGKMPTNTCKVYRALSLDQWA